MEWRTCWKQYIPRFAGGIKKELKIARVSGFSILWTPAPPHGMYPRVSSMEWKHTLQASYIWKMNALWWLTDVTYIYIYTIKQSWKILSLWPWPQGQWGGAGLGGMEQRKSLDQCLTLGKASTESIQRFKRYLLLKTLSKKFSVKFRGPWPWPKG